MVSLGGGASLGTAVLDLATDDKRLNQGLDRAEGNVKSKIRTLGKFAAGAGLAAGAALVGFGVASIRQFAAVGDELDKMASRTGLTVEALSELRFATQQSGAAIEALDPAMRRLNRVIAQGENASVTWKRALEGVGLSMAQLQQASPDERFRLVAEAIGSIEDPALRTEAAFSLFGDTGTQLLPFFNQGAEGMAALRQEAHELGIVMSQEDATAAAEMNDAFARLKDAVQGLMFAFARDLVPALTELADRATVWAQEHGPALAESLSNITMNVAELTQRFVRGLQTISPLWNSFVDNVLSKGPLVQAALLAIGATAAIALGLATGGLSWVLMGVVAAVGAVVIAIGDLSDNWQKHANEIIEITERLSNAVVGGLEDLAEGGARAFDFLADRVIDAVDKMLLALEKLAKGAAAVEKTIEFLSGGQIDIPSAEGAIASIRAGLRDFQAKSPELDFGQIDLGRFDEPSSGFAGEAGLPPGLAAGGKDAADALLAAANATDDLTGSLGGGGAGGAGAGGGGSGLTGALGGVTAGTHGWLAALEATQDALQATEERQMAEIVEAFIRGGDEAVAAVRAEQAELDAAWRDVVGGLQDLGVMVPEAFRAMFDRIMQETAEGVAGAVDAAAGAGGGGPSDAHLATLLALTQGGATQETLDAVNEHFKNLPRLQHGGIVRSPTLAMIGEAGPEAVVPLDRARGGGGVIIQFHGPVSSRRGAEEMVRGAISDLRRRGVSL